MNMIKWMLITVTAVVLILGLVSILYVTDTNAFSPGYPAMRGMMNGGGPNSRLNVDRPQGSNFMMRGPRQGRAQAPGFQGTGFVDENGDGVCDNCGQGGRMSRGPGFVDEDGDGVCDNCGQGGRMGRGPGFVDEDGDGVCDNCGQGGRMGRGPGFVDEDGDGVCDNCGQGRGTGRGPGFVDEDGDGVCDHYQQNQASQN